MKVFALIMHYQTEHLTSSVISQLQALPEEVNVIVYDDGSDRPFIDDKAFVIRSSKNMGYVKAVNNAISLTIEMFYEEIYDSPDVAIWTLNTDVKGLTAEMLSALIEKLNADKSLAAVSPAVIGSPHTVMHPGPEKEKYVPYIDWVAPLVRLSAWRALGGFDTNLKGFGCDIDFSKRARDKNWRFCVLPKQRIEHEGGGTTKTLTDDKGHSDLEWMNDYLCKKHGVHTWTELKKK